MKRITYQWFYKILLFLSNYFDNRYLKKYKIWLGTSLLVLTSACQHAKKDKPDEVLSYMPVVQEDAVGTQSPDSLDDVMCYEPGLGKDDVHTVVDVMPEFPGGTDALLEYVSASIRYPESCIKDSIQGRVIVQFVVDKEGVIRETEIIRGSLDDALDKEALRIVNSMPRWKPGIHRGRNVKTRYLLPVKFKLPE